MKEEAITLTPSAMAHVQKWIIKENAKGLRLSVKKTGCSGLSYVTEMIHEINPEDIVVEINTPFEKNSFIIIFIDSKSFPYLKGICLDFAKPADSEQQGLLQGPKLLFINPNQTGVCGCGESFSID